VVKPRRYERATRSRAGARQDVPPRPEDRPGRWRESAQLAARVRGVQRQIPQVIRIPVCEPGVTVHPGPGTVLPLPRIE